MSSQTPNINLILPTGAEKVSRQIINDNNTKIDTAIGTLNGNIKRTVLTTATDFNTLRVNGNSQNQYYCGDNIAIHSNIPTGIGDNTPFTLDVVSMGSYSVQILKTYASTGGPEEYKRQTYYSSGSTPYNTWTFQNFPFRRMKALPANGTATFTLPSYFDSAIIFAATSNSNGVFYIYTNGYLCPVKTATGLTVSISSDYKTITVTNSTSATTYAAFISCANAAT